MAIATKEMPVGQELPPVKKEVTMDRMRLYTDWASVNIHTDWVAADKAGFPAPIAQGLMSHSYLSEMLTQFFGESWLRGGKLSVKFISYVVPADTIIARGVVKEKRPEGDGVRMVVEVWCENQKGQKVTVGEASAVVK
ncbi:MAG: MaoC family dehydratase [Chloroflexota bacterium]|nr:MaoC family dehydratase [Chloroflexota bacterium]